MTWAREKGIRIEYIQPGKPQQNAYVESYNRTVAAAASRCMGVMPPSAMFGRS